MTKSKQDDIKSGFNSEEWLSGWKWRSWKRLSREAPWVRILPPPPILSVRRNGRVAEGARLLSEYRCCYLSRVRISISPPLTHTLGFLSIGLETLFLFQFSSYSSLLLERFFSGTIMYFNYWFYLETCCEWKTFWINDSQKLAYIYPILPFFNQTPKSRIPILKGLQHHKRMPKMLNLAC